MPPQFTEQHVTFMKSENFKKNVPVENSEVILQLFSDHIMGEVTAQTARGEAGGASSNGGTAVTTNEGAPAPSEEGNMGTVVPGRMMGGDEVPSGMPGSKSGVQVGRKV